jgi:hypothetical protein
MVDALKKDLILTSRRVAAGIVPVFTGKALLMLLVGCIVCKHCEAIRELPGMS